MIKENLIKNIKQVESLSNASKLTRLLHNPFKYIYAIFLKKLVYPVFQKEVSKYCKLFTGKKIKVLLPASTDIYLTGGKSHSSEIRLAKFIILNLKSGDTFWDIGAHYGYFSLIAADLVGKKGSVLSIEASPTTFKILKENCSGLKNTSILNNIISNGSGKNSFFELPNLYSEYNSTDLTQFKNEQWFNSIKAKK